MKTIAILSVVVVFAFISQTVVSDMVKSSATAFRWPTATVSCPSGKTLTGGGGRCTSLGAPGTGWTFLSNSYPINDAEWTVTCDTPVDQNVKAEAYILCN